MKKANFIYFVTIYGNCFLVANQYMENNYVSFLLQVTASNYTHYLLSYVRTTETSLLYTFCWIWVDIP